MAIHRLNHVVLYVRDAEASAAFYRDVLGFQVVFGMAGRAAFMRADGSTNDHDLAVMTVGADAAPSSAGAGSVGMYHVAWEVETLADLRDVAARLTDRGALVGASDHGTTKSLYAKDPDGLEFEVVWLIPADHLTDADISKRSGRPLPLDLPAEIDRFGADLQGGLGISRPAAAHP